MSLRMSPLGSLLLVLMLVIGSPAGATNLGANLLANPGAEAGPASPDGFTVVAIPGWTAVGTPNVVSWSQGGGFPILTDPGPAVRGANFFSGGPSEPATELRQTFDVSDLAALVDAGTLPFKLQGWLGGYSGQNDNAQVQATFRNGALATIGTAGIGPVSSADRAGATGLLYRQATGTLPAGTRSVLVSLLFSRTDGSYNDGYADSLVFVVGAGIAAADDPSFAAGPWLAPVTPNPGRGPARLRFGLPERAAVRLEVFDVSGRRVGTAVADVLEAGVHELDWDDATAGRVVGDGAGSLPSGVYFARLAVGNRVLSRRFVRLP